MSTQWFELEEDQFNELIRLSRMYRREADRCHRSKACLAGCVMAAAALETSLLAMVHLYAVEVESAGLIPMRQQAPQPLLKWTMSQLLEAASGMGWLPRSLKPGDSFDGRRAEIGDYADSLRQIRNFVHPGRYVRDHSPSRITRRYTETAIEVLDVSLQWLCTKVEERIAEQIDSGE